MHENKDMKESNEEEIILDELNEGTDESTESVFCEAKEKTPPDQMSHLIKIIQGRGDDNNNREEALLWADLQDIQG